MTDPATPLLEARAISKSFAQTRALVGANLTLRPGVTHALLGANGAGKSTLSRVISGHVRRDGGEILYRGAAARRPQSARSARRRHRHGHAGDQPRAGPLGAREHFPPRSRPARPPVAPDDAPAGERDSRRSRPGARGLARRGGARPFRRAAPARRDRESARAQSQSHHFRRADGVLEPERGRAPVRRHRAARKRAMRDRLRLASSGGSVRDLGRDHGDARGAHGRGLDGRLRA